MIINILVATIVSYLIISIFRKDFPLLTEYEKYNYKGNKASLLAGGLLFIFVYLLSLENSENMNLVVIVTSFIFGTPIAYFLHIQLSKNPGTLIPSTTQHRKITTSNLILYGVLGIFVGFITSMFAFLISAILNLSFYVTILFVIFVFIGTVVIVAKWGARTPFGGYNLLGMAQKEDEEKIKNILCNNNIPYLISPILRKEFLNNKRFKKYNRDNKILIPNNDNKLIRVLINENYYNKAENLLGNLIDVDSVWYL